MTKLNAAKKRARALQAERNLSYQQALHIARAELESERPTEAEDSSGGQHPTTAAAGSQATAAPTVQTNRPAQRAAAPTPSSRYGRYLSRHSRPGVVEQTRALLQERLCALRAEYEASAPSHEVAAGTRRAPEPRDRPEQELLRQLLTIGTPTADCDLCGRTFAVENLRAAHIKLWAQCTVGERFDVNVVMRACTFGCDQLYELGLLGVDDAGRIRVAAWALPASCEERAWLGYLHGRRCAAFRSGTADYFAWHYRYSFRGVEPPP